MDLFHQSISIILANQAPSGAYPASPNFPPYHYCWFRDGAFIAYAMDLVGQHESAHQFHDWASRTILRHRDKAQKGILRAQRGERPREGEYLHARYTLAGEESQEPWGNFQLDGLGSWLWALAQHEQMTGEANSQWEEAAQLIVTYLTALWRQPCYDWWEEQGDKIHVSTLASIYGGLEAINNFYELEEVSLTCREIRRFVLERGVYNGHLVKYIGYPGVDGSLLAAATPFRLLKPDDSLMKTTVALIQQDLQGEDSGLHRYQGDTYYGGGEWILLTAWLGWHCMEVGKREEAQTLLNWVEAQADEQGQLPEQVPHSLYEPTAYRTWVERWGPIAKPLLWSHASYLILYTYMYS